MSRSNRLAWGVAGAAVLGCVLAFAPESAVPASGGAPRPGFLTFESVRLNSTIDNQNRVRAGRAVNMLAAGGKRPVVIDSVVASGGDVTLFDANGTVIAHLEPSMMISSGSSRAMPMGTVEIQPRKLLVDAPILVTSDRGVSPSVTIFWSEP